jgi:L-ascorbate metabolism protein UlaG (beta-lactamase superfamily)
MKITYYGHSCFLAEINGKRVFFDPFISPNEKASHIDVSKLTADYIFLSHGHSDHVADVEAIYRQSDAQLVSTFEVIEWFAKKGIENGHGMNHGGNWTFDFGKVKMVNAIHSSSMPDGSYGGNPAGFVVRAEEKTFYYAGDTALHMDMQLIEEEFDIDFAFLPIGDNFTMGISDAARAARMIGTSRVIGMHYDTFPPIEINHEKAKAVFNEHGAELILLSVGESFNF